MLLSISRWIFTIAVAEVSCFNNSTQNVCRIPTRIVISNQNNYGKKNGPIPTYCIKQLKFGHELENVYKEKRVCYSIVRNWHEKRKKEIKLSLISIFILFLDIWQLFQGLHLEFNSHLYYKIEKLEKNISWNCWCLKIRMKI